jgi:hypothetical protein
MSKDWRTICRFSLLGLAIAAIFFVYFETDPPPGSSMALWTGVAALFLCPGGLLFVTAIDIEPQTFPFAIEWLVIGLINAALYAVIGAAYVGLRKKPDRPVRS